MGRAGRDQGELYRGARLAAALDWTAGHALDLNELEREFVTESRESSEQETGAAGARTGASACCSQASRSCSRPPSPAGCSRWLSAARRATRERRARRRRQLAQRLGAQALVADDFGLSLLLARQAVEIADTPQTRGYLLTTLVRAPKAIGIMHGPDSAAFSGLALSPDGRTLAVTDFYNRVLFFDALTHERLGQPIRVIDWVEGIAYSPDGETLAYGGRGLRPPHRRADEEAARRPTP